MIGPILNLMGLALEISGAFILSIEAIGFGRIEGWIRSLKIVGFRSTKQRLAPGELDYSNSVLLWLVGVPVILVEIILIFYLNLGWGSFIIVLLGFVAMYILNRVASICLARIADLLNFLEEKAQRREVGVLGFLFLFVGFIFEFAGTLLPIIR